MDDVNSATHLFYSKLSPVLQSGKMKNYFECLKISLSKENSSLSTTKCRLCNESDISKIKIRLLSKRALSRSHNRSHRIPKSFNALSVKCRTCRKTFMTPAIDRRCPPPVFKSEMFAVKPAEVQKQQTTPNSNSSNSTSKRRPRKSMSKLQQQLQRSKDKQNNPTTNLTLSDFLSL